MPVSSVVEYSVHPLYLQALSERIDQALQRFPKRLRGSVEVLYCAEHAQVPGRFSKQDSFCDLARSTVDRLTDLRGDREPGELICFRSGVRTSRSDEKEMRAALARLKAKNRAEYVLVVPLGVSTDHVWTAYTLDIVLRHVAADIGLRDYEVVSGLNCHPLYISALVDVISAQLNAPATDRTTPRSRTQLSSRQSEREAGCATCRGPVRARDWSSPFYRGAAQQ